MSFVRKTSIVIQCYLPDFVSDKTEKNDFIKENRIDREMVVLQALEITFVILSLKNTIDLRKDVTFLVFTMMI